MNQTPSGPSGLGLLVAFVGGAVAGALVAFFAQAQNRKTVKDFAQLQFDRASRIPTGLREASSAAAEAFVEAVVPPARVPAGRG